MKVHRVRTAYRIWRGSEPLVRKVTAFAFLAGCLNLAVTAASITWLLCTR